MDHLTQLQAALSDRYTFERELGLGGMATVYLARDLKHGRLVALKVLRPELATTLGPARFLHEIEIAAQLQHPHILPLLDSGEAGGFLYYVMPYIDGESLRERLAREGELPVSDAIRILAEIADALSYAHDRGVVHRDMKPENIMLSGRHPLIMDFGIAKAVSPAGATRQVTTEGVALGTPAYMAPEQAAADPHLDHRVDIYALGVIGYELLTGSPPFTGTSAQQVLAAHMTHRPEPISSRRPTVPVALASLIMLCLEKRPADRPQAADEVLRTLEAMVTPGEGLTPTGSRPVAGPSTIRTRRALVVGGAILVLIATAGLLWRGRSTTAGASAARHTQLTFVGNVRQQEISPDGQLLAYLGGEETGRLFVKDLRGGSTILISPLGDVACCASLGWSPDGSSILYSGPDSSGHWISVLFPRLGGPPRPLPVRGTHIALSPDGSRVASWLQPGEYGIRLMTLGDGSTDTLRVPEVAWLDGGVWSPVGNFLAILTNSHDGTRWKLWNIDLQREKWHEIVADSVPLSPPRWSQIGDLLYYIRDRRDLYKVRVGPAGVRNGVAGILQTEVRAAQFSITADGRTVAYTKSQTYSNLWLATAPRPNSRFNTRQLTRGTALKSGASFSPNGQLIAFIQSEEGKGDVFVLALASGLARRITSSGVTKSRSTEPQFPPLPAWSRDGQSLAFIATTKGKNQLRTVSLDAGPEHQFEGTNVGVDLGLAWGPHQRLLYQSVDNRNLRWLDPASGAEEQLVTNDSLGWMFSPHPSPDGRYVAVHWSRKNPGVYLISVSDSSQIYVGPANGRPLGWSRDGAYVYVEGDSGRIHRIPARGGRGAVVGINPFKMAPCELRERGRELDLLCSVEESVSDVWMLENVQTSPPRFFPY